MGREASKAVPPNAAALRPWRIKDGRAVHFTGALFADPYQGCEITIRRMDAFGMVLKEHGGHLAGDTFVDVLDVDGDILHTFEITRRGFEYLRQKLQARREPSTLGEHKAAQVGEVGNG
ncbi:hypothetical protein [Pseudoxanthomonas sp. USHLN014]|uniref:hypothetical protein n=1 Tax=Pseudoxanthomonas sp. USHLN014 TaxID=3081297 RepID=UPI00301E2291